MSTSPFSSSCQSPLWMRLLGAIGKAASVRQMLIACAAICGMGIGRMVIDWINPPFITVPANVLLGMDISPTIPIDAQALNSPPFVLSFRSARIVIRPWEDLYRSTTATIDEGLPPSRRLTAVIKSVWSLMVWSVFGIALCRLAARQFARDESGSFRKSLQFGVTRFRHALTAPLIPTLAALMLVAMAVIAALPGRLPWVGSAAVALITPAVLLLSLLAAFLMLATLLGWPLMIAAIAYDDCDGFGGLSRSYSLWTGRPLQFAWYWFITMVTGVAVILVVGWFSNSAVRIAATVFRVGIGDAQTILSAQSSAYFWMEFLVSAYGVSYFWTNATMIYALLRQSVDQMPTSSIAPDDDERLPRDPLPVVGMPAMNQE